MPEDSLGRSSMFHKSITYVGSKEEVVNAEGIEPSTYWLRVSARRCEDFRFYLVIQQLILNLARTEAFVSGIEKAHFSARCSAWHGTLTAHLSGVNPQAERSSRQCCESCEVKVLAPPIACSWADSISDACKGNDARSARM